MNSFRILSIDGGGMKGLFSLAFLSTIEEIIKSKISNYFDLIVGTSTGGIIALGIGLGFTTEQILDLYSKHGTQIFPREKISSAYRSFNNLFHPKYNNKKFESILIDFFNKYNLGNSKNRLVIPSFNPATGDVYLFKTAHHIRFVQDYKLAAWKVARATSAAPTFFSSQKIGIATDLIDGGLWANNPSIVAITEAIGILEQKIEDIALLSIGQTNSSISINKSTRKSGGIIQWLYAASPNLFMHLQLLVAHKQASHLLAKGIYYRIDPGTFPSSIPLDHPGKALDLIPYGEQAARFFFPRLEKSFFSSYVRTFEPLYK